MARVRGGGLPRLTQRAALPLLALVLALVLASLPRCRLPYVQPHLRGHPGWRGARPACVSQQTFSKPLKKQVRLRPTHHAERAGRCGGAPRAHVVHAVLLRAAQRTAAAVATPGGTGARKGHSRRAPRRPGSAAQPKWRGYFRMRLRTRVLLASHTRLTHVRAVGATAGCQSRCGAGGGAASQQLGAGPLALGVAAAALTDGAHGLVRHQAPLRVGADKKSGHHVIALHGSTRVRPG
jgi:hypothetical protein